MSLVCKLKTLVEINNRKKTVEQVIADCRTQISTLQNQIEKLSRLVTLEQATLRQLQKNIDSSQLDLDVLRNEESTRRAQLARESNGDTLRLLTIEVSRFERRRLSAENELEELWHQLEKSRNHLKLLQEQTTLRIQELEKKISELSLLLAAESLKLQGTEAEILAVLDTVPRELKEQILSMEKASTQAPVAPVIQNVCGACFYPLSNRDISFLAQKDLEKVLTCQNCFIILYLDPVA